jgi:asparagine synthase (glutamine-hydrolysing)
MCGIAGTISLDGRRVRADEVRAMCAAMVHRGPDAAGFFFDTEVALGMRRLSIIDLATGVQPIRNEDGTIWIVFNGEIYNFHELRCELEQRGHTFVTTSDTETIVHLYEEYGRRCVERLRGMFAFAIWDGRRRELFAARDRLGIKPFYYAETAGRLAFASELRALLEVPTIDRSINWRALNRLVTFLTTPQSEAIVSGVKKLPPGHLLIAAAGRGVRVEPYWDVVFAPDYGKSERWFVERLRELLAESVQLHLVSDVPVGAFLSGGIDSSAVVATMTRLRSDPVKTFSIGFREAEYSEAPYARRVASHTGTQHHELILGPGDVPGLDEMVRYLDEPFGDASAIPTYAVSRLAARHVKVVLSGDGGDELFGGYTRYLVEARERRRRLPWPARRLLAVASRIIPDGMRGRNFTRHFALAGFDRYLDAGTMFRADDRRRLFRSDVLSAIGDDDPLDEERRYLSRVEGDWLSAAQYLDVKSYLPLDILTKVDRMSMAVSLEARVPLLDHRVVEFAATIPPELQVKNGVPKYILKRAMDGILPPDIIERPKHGFEVPLERWFRGDLSATLREVLLSDRTRRRGIFDVDHIARMIEWQRRGRSLYLHLWTLLTFELWCRQTLDRGAPAPTTPDADVLDGRVPSGRSGGAEVIAA